jgi:HEAT repeat protein
MKTLVQFLAFGLAITAYGYETPDDATKLSRPSPDPYKHIWEQFYAADCEGSIAPALIAGGPQMVPHICQAIKDSQMYCRRYAILALGHLRDRRAIRSLETIYSDTDEDVLFRGDALEAIFVIDQELGRRYASIVLKRSLPKNDYLRSTAELIFKEPKSLLELATES